MVDVSGSYLAIAREQREDRQAGGIGGGPAFGAQSVPAQVEDRPRARFPAGAMTARVVELIQLAGALLQHEHVAVAFFARALDGCVGWDRIWPGVGFFAEFAELDRHSGLVWADDRKRDAVAGIRSEVRGQVQVGAYRGDVAR